MHRAGYMKWYALAMNERAENSCIEPPEPVAHLRGKFIQLRNVVTLVGLGIALLNVAGCSRTCGNELFADIPDLPPSKVISYYME